MTPMKLNPATPLLLLVSLLPSCAAPSNQDVVREVAELRREVGELRGLVERHGRAEAGKPTTVESVSPSAAKRMTIDSVTWSDESRYASSIGKGRPPMLLAHVLEWSGWDDLKQFTIDADPSFWLEAPGQKSVSAHMGQGGISNPDGSVRLVILSLQNDALEPGVEYALRPANQKLGWEWVVGEGVAVVRTP